jgi:uncharacterized membrane protein YhaH (DUF805 family)
MGALSWPIGRMSRSNAFVGLILLSVGFISVDWFAFNRVNVMLVFGLRFDALRNFDAVPIWRIAFEFAANLLLCVGAIARLHDASYSTKWLVTVLALSFASMMPFASSLAFVSLIAWIIIIFLPPSIGPNRFGPDPRGWKSREHFANQQRMLAEQRKK